MRRRSLLAFLAALCFALTSTAQNFPQPGPGMQGFFSSTPDTSPNDDFNDGTMNTAKWALHVVSGTGTTITETGGNFSLNHVDGVGTNDYRYWRTNTAFDLTGKYVYTDVIQRNTTGEAEMSLRIANVTDDTDYVEFLFTGNSIYYAWSVNGSWTSLGNVTWNAVTHKYIRLREASGTIYFDYSSDASSWNNFSSWAASGFDYTDVKVWIGGGSYADLTPNDTTPGLINAIVSDLP